MLDTPLKRINEATGARDYPRVGGNHVGGTQKNKEKTTVKGGENPL